MSCGRSPSRRWSVPRLGRRVEERKFLCKGCGQWRPCNPRLPPGVQEYCSWPACQRKRKARWQQERLRTDLQYATDQREADAGWHAKVPDYHKNYDANRRKTRPVVRVRRPRARRGAASGRQVVTVALGGYQLRVSVQRSSNESGNLEEAGVELALVRVQPAPGAARGADSAVKDGRVPGA